LARQELNSWGAGEVDERVRSRELAGAVVIEHLWNMFDDCHHEFVWAREGVVNVVESPAPVTGCAASNAWTDVPSHS
jgi:hypothetical protein